MKMMVFNNFMEIQMGGEVFELGNPEWRGAQAVLEIQVEGGGGGKKNCAFHHGGVDFFWNNPLRVTSMLSFSEPFLCLLCILLFSQELAKASVKLRDFPCSLLCQLRPTSQFFLKSLKFCAICLNLGL